MSKFNKIFNKKNKPIVIGMVHCAPLLGYDESPGIKKVEKYFLQDLKALIDGGVDAVMIENNYDIPHFEHAEKSTVPQLTDLCIKARKLTKKPLGLCVLWNDYETALSIAKMANLNFVRIPVFVDKVKTDYGIYSAKADECIKFRKKINAEDILIFADVQVKHAKHLIKRPLKDAVKEALKEKTDGVIITGKWTGDPPTKKDILESKKVAKNIPIILGSGINPENIKKFNAEAVIIGSYLKESKRKVKKDYHNIFPAESRINKNKVKKFMDAVKK